MTEEAVVVTEPAPDSAGETLPADQAVEPGATETVVETDEQKNERVQKEAKDRADKRARGVQKRIDELTADKYAERAARERAERELEALRKRAEQGQQSQQTRSESGEPKREDFQSYEEYIVNLASHRARAEAIRAAEEVRRKGEEETQARTAKQQSADEHRAFLERQAEFIKTTPDYMEVMEDAGDLNLPESVFKMLRVMPDGPALAYHLVKNADALKSLSSQPPEMHGFVLGQMSASLKSAPRISKAPAPGTPVRSKAGSDSEPPTNPDEYQAWARKHMR